jgi:hypothetical protein
VFAVVVCIGTEDRYASVAKPGILRYGEADTVVIELRDQASIHIAYNKALDTLRTMPGLEGAIFIHEDLAIEDADIFKKLRRLFEDQNIAIAGAIGAVGVSTLSWWLGQRRGWLRESRFELDFSDQDIYVDTLDGCFLAFSPWSIANLRFDETTYTGFHGYDADICFSARSKGKKVVWNRFDLFHRTRGGFGDMASFISNDEAFREKWILANAPQDWEVAPNTCLELGGGTKCRRDWLNLDPVHGTERLKIMAEDTPWPFEDATVSHIYASHVFEHIPAGVTRVEVMNECHRILVPGGSLEIRVPIFPHPAAIADPTNVSFWVKESIYYFTGDLRADANYGILKWDLGHIYVADGWELRAVLVKPVSVTNAAATAEVDLGMRVISTEETLVNS